MNNSFLIWSLEITRQSSRTTNRWQLRSSKTCF